MAISNVSNSSSSSGTSSSSSSSSSAKGIANNFDQFLTLLTTQLKNQSPLDPLDTNQFTQQLVQFAGVEQQLKANDTLSSLLSLSAAGTATNAVGFIGSTITADGATAQLSGGAAAWKVNSSAAGNATVTIKDANGSVVQTMTRSLVAGDQTLTWDGKTSIGTAAPDGAYTVTIDGRSVSGDALTVKTQIGGVVDGVDFTSSIPTLKIGAISVPIDKVKGVVRTK
ncbi:MULTISPECIES: flagellar hook capping FlgD N-terminal domain-containing protein [unclassified Bosea (in: a-proteobacteria)]|uniref:flagellar hook assembly protein FlgD n=1 Tax=unclassified Bosea (in: a-proteobacteria) TaxID=2653178 RepID=UPI000956559E|nr:MULTISPECIES: flagellar hook capping FlgD N-terminal domain-containing protein [unclassified Bosea (in: a-proteobacteria)]TAJ31796.1 MAG: flagellar hook assembly protein FlgD [Bosea sp. (in: a-proteobacteria)]SIQ36088.1 flagellar basal-body rod modification protein FlgD [Bosea sp. TND4EK4]